MKVQQDKASRRRRSGVPPALAGDAPAVEFDDGRLEVRSAERTVRTDGQHLQLTPNQMGVLFELVRHSGRVRSREQLKAAVWGPESEASPRAVDVAVARLRAQLRRRIPGVAYVHTELRSGYRFLAEPTE